MTLALPAWLSIAAALADLATTHIGLWKGYREANPLIRSKTAGGTMSKAIAFHAIALASCLYSLPPDSGWWWAVFGIFAAVAAWNIRQFAINDDW